MASFPTLTTFAPNTTILSDEANSNFSLIKNWIVAEAIQKDGSVAMTSNLTLSGDPASTLHAATKQYVDAPRNTAARASQATTSLMTLNTFTQVINLDDTGAYGYDTGSNIGVGTNTYVVPTTGLYALDWQVTGSVPGFVCRVVAAIRKNGSELTRGSDGSGYGGNFSGSHGSDSQQLVAGDLLTLWGYCEASGALIGTTVAGTNYTYMAIRRV